MIHYFYNFFYLMFFRHFQHTAPQHRQYLSFDGVGCGTPAQREKQHQQSRASKAYGKVLIFFRCCNNLAMNSSRQSFSHILGR